jgi:streptomycin 6-kinase
VTSSAADGLLADYLSAWNLRAAERLATTATSSVYTVESLSGPAVLKIFTHKGQVDEAGGAPALQAFDGDGAVRLLRHDARAQLLEPANGGDLTTLVAQGRDGEATRILADVMNRLHGVHTHPGQSALTPLRRRFASLFQRAARDDDRLFTEAAASADRLLSAPLDERTLHGDVHHANVCLSESRGWLAIDPKGLVGECTFDAANVVLNPVELPRVVLAPGRCVATLETLAAAMDLDRQRLLSFTFCFACLSACWSDEDGEDPMLALAVAGIVRPHMSQRFE